MKITIIIIAILLVLFIISQIYFIMAKTESQPYKVVKTEKEFEIRLYPSATMASITMNTKNYKELSSSGFKKLAGFIFGGNNGSKNIAMTSPVHMDIQDSGSSMSFVMPANYNKDNLPKPNDSTIYIQSSVEEYVAAIEFGGFANDEQIRFYSSKLESELKNIGIEYFGNFRYLGYNAPYQVVGRRNEIIVSIRWNEK